MHRTVGRRGGFMVSALESEARGPRSSPGRRHCVVFFGLHFTLKVPLSTQEYMGTGKLNAGGNPVMNYHPIQGGVEILLAASCYRNRDEFRPDEPLGSYADLTFFLEQSTRYRKESQYQPCNVSIIISMSIRILVKYRTRYDVNMWVSDGQIPDHSLSLKPDT